MALGEQLREARRMMKQTTSEVAAATRMKVQIVEAIEKEDFSRIAAPIYGKGFIRLYAEHVGLDPHPMIDEYMTRFVERKTPSLVTEEPAPPPPHPAPDTTEPVPASPPSVAEEPVRKTVDDDLFSRIDRPPRRRELRGQAPAMHHPPNVRSRSLREIAGSAAGSASRAVSRFWRECTFSTQVRLQSLLRRFSEPAGAKPDRPEKNKMELPWLKPVSVTAGIVIILIFVVSGLSRCIRPTVQEAEEPVSPERLRLAVEPPAPYFD